MLDLAALFRHTTVTVDDTLGLPAMKQKVKHEHFKYHTALQQGFVSTRPLGGWLQSLVDVRLALGGHALREGRQAFYDQYESSRLVAKT